jgi:TetR/AcrR family transcriptional regulator, ethionamide resistance regulator
MAFTHMVTGESERGAPRRRSREQVEADVQAALLRLLDEGIPFKDLTVDELARAAGLSRTAFYFYYPGKSQVLMAVAAAGAGESYEESDRWWSGEGPPEELIRAAIEGNLRVYLKHKTLFRTTAEVIHYDEEFHAFYKAQVDRFVNATTEHLHREREAGRLREDIDIESVTRALCWMAERCNNVLVGIEGRDPGEVVDALTAIWVHSLYPDRVTALGA